MSENFLRRYKFTIVGDDGKGVIIQDHQIDFTITLNSDSKLNDLECNIYNLSINTLAIFDKTDTTVTLEVGYEGQPLVLAFKGRKIFAATKRESTDLITNLIASDGAVIVREGRVQIATPEQSTVESVIREIIKKGMTKITTVSIDSSLEGVKKTYNRGYSASGGAKEQLDAVCNANGLRWHIIQDTAINVFPRSGNIGRKAYVITPTMIKDNPEKTSDEVKKLKDDLSVPRQLGLNLKLQLNPLIIAGALVKLEGTFNADGVYLVERVKHQGNYEGEQWDTSLECTVYA